MNYGKIISIKEVCETIKRTNFEGYRINTDNSEIVVLIEDGTQCCESAGYFSSNDDLSDFIGADLQNVILTDKELNSIVIEKVKELYEPEIQFVNFETNKGNYQLTVYNAHNGYYSHDILIKVNDKILDDSYL